MAKSDRQNQKQTELNDPATAMAQDYSLVLMKVIEEAANDPAQLRKLVYVMAWYSLRPEAVISRPVLDAPMQAKTVFELEQALELERAIKRVEAAVALQDQKLDGKQRQSPVDKAPRAAPDLATPLDAADRPDQSSTIAAPISSGQPPASE